MQRIRLQADTNGALTWTFPAAFANGVIPVVECTVEAPSGALVPYFVQLQGPPTNTAVNVRVWKAPAASITVALGNLTLYVAAASCWVHLTAKELTA